MKFTSKYLEALDHADAVALTYGSEQLEPFHILLGVLTIEECEATEILEGCGVTLEWVNSIMLDVADAAAYKAQDFLDEEIPASRKAMKVMDNAEALADSMKMKADVNHIALSLLYSDALTRILVGKMCPPDDICRVLSTAIIEQAAKNGVKVANQVIIEEME